MHASLEFKWAEWGCSWDIERDYTENHTGGRNWSCFRWLLMANKTSE